MMPETTTPEPWGQGVQITPPKLQELVFRDEGDDRERPEANVQYSLSLHRAGPLRLGVEFGVDITDAPGLTLGAKYRMVAQLVEGTPEASNPEKAFQAIAARVAPVAMYPFIRETLLSVTMKALLDPLLLPITNVGMLWKPDDIEVPTVEDGTLGEQTK